MNKSKIQIKKLRKMYNSEREKISGYDELIKIQNAYIAILLKRLNASEDAPVVITSSDIKEIIGSDIVKVDIGETGEWKFYIKTE